MSSVLKKSFLNSDNLFDLIRGKKWDDVISKTKANPSKATKLTKYGNNPIHMACSYKSVPLDVFKSLYEAHPDSLKTKGENGFTPLMCFLVKHKAPPRETLTYLLEQYPDAAKVPSDHGELPLHYAFKCPTDTLVTLIDAHPDACKHRDRYGYLPLHLFCDFRVPCDKIAILLDRYPAGAAVATKKGRLALHNAVGCRLATIERLIEAHPAGCQTTDDLGSLPLHNFVMETPSEEVLMALIKAYPKALLEANANGYTPMMLAADQGVKSVLSREKKKLVASGEVEVATGDGNDDDDHHVVVSRTSFSHKSLTQSFSSYVAKKLPGTRSNLSMSLTSTGDSSVSSEFSKPPPPLLSGEIKQLMEKTQISTPPEPTTSMTMMGTAAATDTTTTEESQSSDTTSTKPVKGESLHSSTPPPTSSSPPSQPKKRFGKLLTQIEDREAFFGLTSTPSQSTMSRLKSIEEAIFGKPQKGPLEIRLNALFYMNRETKKKWSDIVADFERDLDVMVPPLDVGVLKRVEVLEGMIWESKSLEGKKEMSLAARIMALDQFHLEM